MEKPPTYTDTHSLSLFTFFSVYLASPVACWTSLCTHIHTWHTSAHTLDTQVPTQPKDHYLYSCASVDPFTLGKRLRRHRYINYFFCLKNLKNLKWSVPGALPKRHCFQKIFTYLFQTKTTADEDKWRRWIGDEPRRRCLRQTLSPKIFLYLVIF